MRFPSLAILLIFVSLFTAAPLKVSAETSAYGGALSYDNRVSLSGTQTNWYKVHDTVGKIHFHNAAVIDGEFSAEVAIVGAGLLKPTAKAVELDFSVTVWDSQDKIIARDKVELMGVSSDGGTYILKGPSVSSNDAAYCSITFQSAWTYGK